MKALFGISLLILNKVQVLPAGNDDLHPSKKQDKTIPKDKPTPITSMFEVPEEDRIRWDDTEEEDDNQPNQDVAQEAALEESDQKGDLWDPLAEDDVSDVRSVHLESSEFEVPEGRIRRHSMGGDKEASHGLQHKAGKRSSSLPPSSSSGSIPWAPSRILYDIFGNVIPPKASPKASSIQVQSQWVPPPMPKIPDPALPPPLKPTRPVHQSNPEVAAPKNVPYMDHVRSQFANKDELKERKKIALDPKQVWLAKGIRGGFAGSGKEGFQLGNHLPGSRTPAGQCGLEGSSTDVRTLSLGPETVKTMKTGGYDAPGAKHTPMFTTMSKDGSKLTILKPPKNLRERALKFTKYQEEVRQEALSLMRTNPQAFKQVAKTWLEQATQAGTMSAKTFNNLIFCNVGVKISEFVGFFKADSLSDAIHKALTSTPTCAAPPHPQPAMGKDLQKGEKEGDKIARTQLPGKKAVMTSIHSPQNPYSTQQPTTKSELQAAANASFYLLLSSEVR